MLTSSLAIISLMQQSFVFEQLNGDVRNLLDDVFIDYIECHIVSIFIGEVLQFSLLLINIDFINIYVMSPLWDIITVQRVMMIRVARWRL